MKHVLPFKSALLASAVTLGLAGCLGGEDDTSTTTSNTTTATAITTDNALDIAGGATSSYSAIKRSGDLANTLTGYDIRSSGTQSAAAQAIRQLAAAEALPRAGLTTSTDVPCSGGGTIKVTTVYARVSSRSVGDSTELVFNNCVENGQTGTGSVKLTYTALTGTQGTAPYSYSIDARFTDLKYARSETEWARSNGTLAIKQSYETSSTATDVSTSSFVIDGQVSAKTVRLTLSNMTARTVLTNSTGVLALSFDETMALTLPNGQQLSGLRLQSLQDVTINSDSMTASGQILVTGSSGKLRITFGNDQAAIEVDANGDGTYEATLGANVAALKARLGL